LFVGGEDSSWLAASEDLRDELEQRDGDVELRVFPGEGHRIAALRGGEILFDTIAAATGAR
jgi:enterochelin esterase-like enzyme